MKKKELEELVKSQKEIIEKLNDDLESYQIIFKNNGYNLVDDPFIPEYLGFTQTLHEENNQLKARIYTKNSFNISRFVNVKDPRWVVLSPVGVTNVVVIENMFTAIVVLRACGMNISMKDYYKENEIEEAKIEAKIKEFEEESIDLLGGGRLA